MVGIRRETKLACKRLDEYRAVMHLPPPAVLKKKGAAGKAGPGAEKPSIKADEVLSSGSSAKPSSAIVLSKQVCACVC